MRELLQVAVEAAHAGARVVRERVGSMGAVRSKASATDLVTEVDVASGVAVARSLLGAYPHARLLVEEPEVHTELGLEIAGIDEGEVWVVDPLDGTTSFVHGFPCYSVAVALLRDGQPEVGVVHNIALGETAAAARGAGATLDARPIAVSQVASVSEALLVTGFPYDRAAPLDRQLAVLGRFLRAPVHGIRRDGSAAIDCCHVAAGRCDGFWEFGLKPWDMAAGVVICREAGATVTDAEGAAWSAASESICAAGAALHPLMLEVIGAAPGADAGPGVF